MCTKLPTILCHDSSQQIDIEQGIYHFPFFIVLNYGHGLRYSQHVITYKICLNFEQKISINNFFFYSWHTLLPHFKAQFKLPTVNTMFWALKNV